MLLGVLILLAVTAPFYAALAIDQGGGAAWYLLFTQGVGRLIGLDDFKDTTTPLYFLHTGLWALLPMSPLVAVTLIRRLDARLRNRKKAPPFSRVPLWWFSLVFVIISLSRFKLPQYVYWLGPPAAVLAAEELVALSSRGLRVWQSIFSVIAAAAAALGAVVLTLAFPVEPSVRAVVVIVSLGLVVAAWRLRGEAERTVAVALASTFGFLVLYHAWIHPNLLEYQPGAEAGAVVRREAPGEQTLQVVDTPPFFSLAFGAQRELMSVTADDAKPGIAVVDVAALDALEQRFQLTVLGRWPSYRVSLPRAPFLNKDTRWLGMNELAVVRLDERSATTQR